MEKSNSIFSLIPNMFCICFECTSIIPSILEKIGPVVCFENVSHYGWKMFETCSFQTPTKCLSQIKRFYFESCISWRGTFEKWKSLRGRSLVSSFSLKPPFSTSVAPIEMLDATDTELLSRYTLLFSKNHFLHFSGDVRETAILKVSENSQKNIVSSKTIWAVQSAN